MGDIFMSMASKFKEVKEKHRKSGESARDVGRNDGPIVKEGEYDYVEHLSVVSELNIAVPDDDRKSM